MKACVIHAAHDLRIEEQAEPVASGASVLVRIRAGGICGSDLHYYHHGRVGDFVIREPLIPGHEFAGEVVETGPEAVRVRPGDHVVVNPGRACGQCRFCREGRGNLCQSVFFMGSASRFPHMQGGFRECVAVAESQCFAVPPGLPFTTAAFAEPLAVALHAATRARALMGRRVLVTGAGPIGLLVLLAARRAGAISVDMTDMLDAPLAAAARIGAAKTFNVAAGTAALEAEAGRTGGYDVVFEASGAAAALNAGLGAVRAGGIVVQIGSPPAGPSPVLANRLMVREIDLRGSFRFGEEFADAVACLAQGVIDVSPLLTAVVPMAEADAAFRLALDRTQSLKVQIAFG